MLTALCRHVSVLYMCHPTVIIAVVVVIIIIIIDPGSKSEFIKNY